MSPDDHPATRSLETAVKNGVIRVGLSGWAFEPWRGVFYPKGLRHEFELAYAANCVQAIEINATFYGLQRPEIFDGWASQVPAHFVFAVKAPRCITHIHRLRGIEAPLADFLASGVLRLGIHLGPILWQLPPNLPFDSARMEAFLTALPRDTITAPRSGLRDESQQQKPPAPAAPHRRPLRHAIETNHESYRCPAFIEMLRHYEVTLVCADSAGWPRNMDLTSDYVYCRLHGAKQLYPTGYDAATLDRWARCARQWARGQEPDDIPRIAPKARPRRRDVFVFFANAGRLRAPANAMELIRRLRT